MNTYKRNAVSVGALFISATILNVLGNNLFNSILEAPDYLARISASENQVILGSILVLLSAFACVGIAVGLYPVLRKRSEALALGSVGLRGIETVLYIVGVVAVLSLLPLSKEYGTAAAPDAFVLRASGTLLLAVDRWAGQLSVIAFAPGALMYYWIMYRSRLVPRWLSAWGLLGAALSLAVALLGVFGRIVPFSTVFILMQLPIGVQEYVLALWLIVRGFSRSAITSLSANTGADALLVET